MRSLGVSAPSDPNQTSMLFFILYAHNLAASRGQSSTDPVIERSALAAHLRHSFEKLGTPIDIFGAAKLRQHHDNPDLFELYFFSSSESETYESGKTYTAPGFNLLERSDFEQYPHGHTQCTAVIEAFTDRLANSKLERKYYEGLSDE